MNREIFDTMRVWAAVTGLVLAIVYFVALYLGYAPLKAVEMLVALIGGFEIMWFAQDMQRRRRQNG